MLFWVYLECKWSVSCHIILERRRHVKLYSYSFIQQQRPTSNLETMLSIHFKR